MGWTRRTWLIIGIVAVVILLISIWAWGIVRGYRLRAARTTSTPAPTVDPSPCTTGWKHDLYRVQTHVHSVLSVPPKFARGFQINPSEYDHALAPDPFDILAAAKARGIDLRFAEHGEVLSTGSWLRLKDKGYQGFEWTLGGVIGGDTVDHIAIYGADQYAGSRMALEASRWSGTECPDLASFYEWLAGASGDWYGVLCHPWLGTSHFNLFSLAPQGGVQQRIVAIGVGGGEHPRHYDDLATGEEYYRQALGQGWVVMPAYEADNFANPVSRPGFDQRFTGLWVPKHMAGNRTAQTDAFLARRGFATVNGLELRFAGLNATQATDWQIMGESFARAASPGDTLRFQFAIVGWRTGAASPVCRLVGLDAAGTPVDVQTLDVYKLDLFSHGGTSGYVATVEVAAGSAVCYYLAVERTGRVVGLTAPIWVDGQLITRPIPIAAPPPIRPTPAPTTPATPTPVPPAPSSNLTFQSGWERFVVDTASPHYAKVQPGEKLELWIRRRCETRKTAVRISLDGGVVYAHEFEWDGGVQSWSTFNDQGRGELTYRIEVFAEDPARGWYRVGTDSRRLKYPWGKTPGPGGEGASQLLWELDGTTDWDDVMIDAGFHVPRQR